MQQTHRLFLLSAVLSAAVAATGCAGHHTSMGAGPSAAPAATSGTARLAAPDLAFVALAAGTDMYEIQASRLAQTRATNAQVRSYAQMLEQHHTATSNELMTLVRAKGATPPTALPADKQARIDQLSRLSGAAFDREYIRMTGVQDHQAAIGQFEQASRTLADRDLKAFAEKSLPILRQHLQQAQGIAGQIAG
jgi:putative membrane protein